MCSRSPSRGERCSTTFSIRQNVNSPKRSFILNVYEAEQAGCRVPLRFLFIQASRLLSLWFRISAFLLDVCSGLGLPYIRSCMSEATLELPCRRPGQKAPLLKMTLSLTSTLGDETKTKLQQQDMEVRALLSLA